MLRTKYGKCAASFVSVCEYIPDSECFVASPFDVTTDELEEIKAMED